MPSTNRRKRRTRLRQPTAPFQPGLPGLRQKGLPRVIVVGQSRTTQALCAAMRRSGVPCQHASTPQQAQDLIGDQRQQRADAVVLVPPLQAMSVQRFMRDAPPGLPVLVVLSGVMAPAAMRKLYKCGVAAVFTWPAEKRALLSTLLRLSAVEATVLDKHRTPVDVAMEERARLALDAEPSFGQHLHVAIFRRSAMLLGRVDALWKLYAAEQIVEQIPGVQDVNIKGVAIQVPKHRDAAIGRAIRQLIQHTAEIDATTIAVAVKDGNVTLSGSAPTQQELVRLTELARHVRGVKSVDRHIVVSARANTNDRAVALAVKQALAARETKGRVEAAVFSGVCVLSGRCANPAEKRMLGELAERQPGVHRVVNKLVVHRRLHAVPQ